MNVEKFTTEVNYLAISNLKKHSCNEWKSIEIYLSLT